jgi:hypothetical protein
MVLMFYNMMKTLAVSRTVEAVIPAPAGAHA